MAFEWYASFETLPKMDDCETEGGGLPLATGTHPQGTPMGPPGGGGSRGAMGGGWRTCERKTRFFVGAKPIGDPLSYYFTTTVVIITTGRGNRLPLALRAGEAARLDDLVGLRASERSSA